MNTMLMLVFFGSFIALIFGLINPSIALPLKQAPTRKNVLFIYGLLMLVSVVSASIFFPSKPLNMKSAEKANPAPTSKPTTAVTSKSTTPAVQAATKKITPEKEDPEVTLTKIAKKYGTSEPVVLDEDGEWTVTAIKELKEDMMMLSVSKQIARDYIFELYASGIPLKHASISILYTPGRKYYRAGLGNDVASTQPDSTWTDKSIGPSIFYDFLESRTNGSAGDGEFSTYIETNLK